MAQESNRPVLAVTVAEPVYGDLPSALATMMIMAKARMSCKNGCMNDPFFYLSRISLKTVSLSLSDVKLHLDF